MQHMPRRLLRGWLAQADARTSTRDDFTFCETRIGGENGKAEAMKCEASSIAFAFPPLLTVSATRLEQHSASIRIDMTQATSNLDFGSTHSSNWARTAAPSDVPRFGR